jgi:hypothetical protein
LIYTTTGDNGTRLKALVGRRVLTVARLYAVPRVAESPDFNLVAPVLNHEYCRRAWWASDVRGLGLTRPRDDRRAVLPPTAATIHRKKSRRRHLRIAHSEKLHTIAQAHEAECERVCLQGQWVAVALQKRVDASHYVVTSHEAAYSTQVREAKNNVFHVFDEHANLSIGALMTYTR